MDKKVYHNILVHYGVSSGPELISRGFIYQQDIDPNHKSKLCRHYLTKKKECEVLDLMKWRSERSDFSSVEQI